MLQLANVSSEDVLYDLGVAMGEFRLLPRKKICRCHWGRGVIQNWLSKVEKCLKAGLAERVRFYNKTFFQTDLELRQQ